MAVQTFKLIVGIVLICVFIGGAIYKIAENNDSVVMYLFISLIMLLIAWAVMRLVSED